MNKSGWRTDALLAMSGRFLLGFCVLAVLLLAGGGLVRWLALPVPAAIVGMVLLLVVLACVGRLVNTVEVASRPLLGHLMLFFIPAVAGVMEQFEGLRAGWLPFLVASVVGAALTLIVTALTFQVLLKRQGRDS